MRRSLWLWLLGAFLLSATPVGAQTDTGLASVYSDSLAGRKTASGEPYDPADYTAAHPSLRLGIRLVVTNPANHKSVTVRVNDRGPTVEGRILDLSRAAALALGMEATGVAPVEIRVLKAGEAAPFAATPAPDAWFQMGAFRTETNAQVQARALMRQGYAPRIRKGGGIYRVYLETTETGTASLAAQLSAAGWKGYLQVTREPPGDQVGVTTE